MSVGLNELKTRPCADPVLSCSGHFLLGPVIWELDIGRNNDRYWSQLVASHFDHLPFANYQLYCDVLQLALRFSVRQADGSTTFVVYVICTNASVSCADTTSGTQSSGEVSLACGAVCSSDLVNLAVHMDSVLTFNSLLLRSCQSCIGHHMVRCAAVLRRLARSEHATCGLWSPLRRHS